MFGRGAPLIIPERTSFPNKQRGASLMTAYVLYWPGPGFSFFSCDLSLSSLPITLPGLLSNGNPTEYVPLVIG